jgi:hypothetical protein
MRRTLIGMALIWTLAACGQAAPGDLAAGNPAPGFSLPSVGGESVALSDYQGSSPVLLFFHMAVG